MNISDAIKTLDEVIPEPENKMVDYEHLSIAIAWKTVKEELQKQISSGNLTDEKKEV